MRAQICSFGQFTQCSEWHSASRWQACISDNRHRRARKATLINCAPLDRSEQPTSLISALSDRGSKQEASFHVPGHKRGEGVSEQAREIIGTTAFQHDFTELAGLDYLASPTGVIDEAQQAAASVFRADRTWFLVNGTSVGIHAAVVASCGPGDCLLLARNCHQSAFAAAVFAGCDTWYVQPECDNRLGIAHGVSPKAIQQGIAAATQAGKTVRAVLLVSPTYFGACSDISGIATMCHEAGAALIVDEAHGSHFAFHDAFPQSAMALGADCVIQSTHKTLSALTQSAMLHVKGPIVDRGRISRALQLLQSSSPSYLLMASLDGARAHAQQHNWQQPIQASRLIRQQLQQLPGLQLLSVLVENCPGMSNLDPLRITVGVQGLGLTGMQVSQTLEQDFGVVAELATKQVVVFALGIGSTIAHAESLVAAFQELCSNAQQQQGQCQNTGSTAQGQQLQDAPLQAAPEPLIQHISQDVNSLQRLSLRDAFWSSTVRVLRSEAAGRLSAELLCPYPPGVPVAVPGELLQQDVIQQLLDVLESGGTVTGASDSTLTTLLVLEDDGQGTGI